MHDRIRPALAGVPETMLWTLYERAYEANLPDGVLKDPEGLRIFQSLDYDFERKFGARDGGIPRRAATYDRLIRQWLEKNPDGLVVSLGEGLETQAYRVDNGRMRWISLDLPESIHVRQKFLPQTDRFQHLEASVLDFSWMDRIDTTQPILFVAQGLFMYFKAEQLREIFSAMGRRFPGQEIIFDIVPRWFSVTTQLGLFRRTAHYRIPNMEFGTSRSGLRRCLRKWSQKSEVIEFADYGFRSGPALLLDRVCALIPALSEFNFAIVRVRL